MGSAVKRTIALPPDLAKQIEEIAETEGKSVSAVLQDALRLAHREYLKREHAGIQGFWSKKAREKGVLTEKDLRRYIND